MLGSSNKARSSVYGAYFSSRRDGSERVETDPEVVMRRVSGGRRNSRRRVFPNRVKLIFIAPEPLAGMKTIPVSELGSHVFSLRRSDPDAYEKSAPERVDTHPVAKTQPTSVMRD